MVGYTIVLYALLSVETFRLSTLRTLSISDQVLAVIVTAFSKLNQETVKCLAICGLKQCRVSQLSIIRANKKTRVWRRPVSAYLLDACSFYIFTFCTFCLYLIWLFYVKLSLWLYCIVTGSSHLIVRLKTTAATFSRQIS